jgi:uncharacterized protein
MSLKRLIFPVVNALAVGMLTSLVGYYLNNIVGWLLIGFGIGLVIGLVAEFGTRRISGWWYRRRLTLVVLLEIPLIVFYGGPYGYVVAMSQPNHTPICCQTPADFGAAYEAVTIPAADGVTLAGWFIPPTGSHQAVVLVLHGSNHNRLGSMWHAERLARAGYGVLVYDQRALGESEGTQQSLGWWDARDLPYVVDYLVARPDVDPERIGAVGLSLGGYILLHAGPDEPRLQAFWVDGVGASTLDDFPMSENVGEHFAWVINQQILWALTVYSDLPAPNSFMTQIPRIAPRPLMMVVGALDSFEKRVNARYAEVLGANGTQWVIETPHVGGPVMMPDVYAERMLAFFEGALLD